MADPVDLFAGGVLPDRGEDGGDIVAKIVLKTPADAVKLTISVPAKLRQPYVESSPRQPLGQRASAKMKSAMIRGQPVQEHHRRARRVDDRVVHPPKRAHAPKREHQPVFGLHLITLGAPGHLHMLLPEAWTPERAKYFRVRMVLHGA